MKPTIFFSHSSLDRERIKPIKDHIIKKTGNAIQIFMSSDGDSIPLGKNWLKEIEDALINCKLMFVWATPNSTQSSWLYFESGYVYSRNIKVVPIGFDGIKLEELPAPLNILQGFNINSAPSLNNIIAVINKEFDLSFHDLFDDDFYENIVIKSSMENSPELLKYVNAITCSFHQDIKIEENKDSRLKENWYGIFKKILEDKKERFTQVKGTIYGVGYKIYPIPDANFPYPEIIIDPLSLNNIWHLVSEMYSNAYEHVSNNIILTIHFNESYTLPDGHYLISSRLVNTEVDLETSHPNLLYRYRNILFRMNINTKYEIQTRNTKIEKEFILLVDYKQTDSIPLLSLIKLLVKQRIINDDWNTLESESF